jgi:hypothetical protein
MSALTDNTHTVEALREILETRLAESAGAAWSIRQYRGTTAAGLLDAMMATTLPAAIIAWAGEDANKEPGRPQRTYNEFHVFLLAEDAQAADGGAVTDAMLDAVKDLVDDYVSGNSVWRYMHAQPVDLSQESLAPNVSCVDATIEVGDH